VGAKGRKQWGRLAETIEHADLSRATTRETIRQSAAAGQSPDSDQGYVPADFCGRRPTDPSGPTNWDARQSGERTGEMTEMTEMGTPRHNTLLATRKLLDSELTSKKFARRLGPVCLNPINYKLRGNVIDPAQGVTRHADALILVCLNRMKVTNPKPNPNPNPNPMMT